MNRGTAAADELSRDEMVSGGKRLLRSKALPPARRRIRRARRLPQRLRSPAGDARCSPSGLEGAEVGFYPVPAALNANYQMPMLIKLSDNYGTKLKAAEREVEIDGNPYIADHQAQRAQVVPKGSAPAWNLRGRRW